MERGAGKIHLRTSGEHRPTAARLGLAAIGLTQSSRYSDDKYTKVEY